MLRQLRLLLRKNVQIHRRNYVSTTVQLCLPIFISFMLWVLRANAISTIGPATMQ